MVDGGALGTTDVEGAGLSVGATVEVGSRVASNAEVAGTSRTTPAPSGGTDSTVQPAPLAPVGVQVGGVASPTVTVTVM